MQEIRALTGLRGVAAIIVFFAHTRSTLQSRGLDLPMSTLTERLFLSGGRQVDIFFVLSGFILALIYRDWFATTLAKKDYFEFLQRRFARIYPLHVFILLMVVLFVVAAGVFHANTVNGLDRYKFSSLPAYVLLVQSWGFLGLDPGAWNPPSWSISIEFMAYLLFPLVMLVTSKYEARRPGVALTLIAIGGFVLNAFVPWGLAGLPGIARGLSEFILGCATAALIGKPVATWFQSRLGSLVTLGFLMVCFALTPDTGFIIGFCTVPLLLTLSADNPVSRVFALRPIYFLGEISFSIYLGHFLFSTIAYRLVSVPWMRSGPLPLALGLLGIIAFVLTLSTATYYGIERPARGILRR